MRLYHSGLAPNARRVRMFLAEKGIAIPLVAVDLAKLEQRSDDFSAKNPFQIVPALELDDGSVITESIAICRYFEETVPEPPLFGRSTIERAQVEMWNRRMEIELYDFGAPVDATPPPSDQVGEMSASPPSGAAGTYTATLQVETTGG